MTELGLPDCNNSNSFFKTYWTLEHLRPCQTNKTIGLSKLDKPIGL